MTPVQFRFSLFAQCVQIPHAFDLVDLVGMELTHQQQPLLAIIVTTIDALQVDAGVVPTHDKHKPTCIFLHHFHHHAQA